MASFRVHSIVKAGALVCTAWLAIHAQDFNEAKQRGMQAWEKGACPDAETAFRQALKVATERVGVVAVKDQAEIVLRLTEALLCVGDHDDALGFATQLISQYPGAPTDILAQMRLFRAEAEKGKGRFADADADYLQAIHSLQQAVPTTDPRLARFLASWSELARLQGDFEKAGARVQQALAAVDNPAGRQSLQRAYAAVEAGDLERERGAFPEARKRYEEARAITQPKWSEHPIAGRAALGLAWVDLAHGKLDSAEQELRLAEATAAHMDRSTIYLQTLDARGMLDLAKRNLPAAQQALQNSLDARRKNRGEQHPMTAIGMDHLGLLFLDQEKADQALEQFKRAEAIQRAVLGPAHPELAATLQDLGRAYRMKGDFAAGETALGEALRIQTAKFGKDSLAVASSHFELATLFAAQRKWPAAEAAYREALMIAAPDTRLHIAAIRGLALVLHRQAKNAESEKLIAEWMESRGQKLPLLDPDRLPVAIVAGEISLEAHQYSDAEKQFRELVEADPNNPAPRYAAQRGLADALLGQQKFREALPLYEAALPNLGEQPGVPGAWENLAQCYAALKQWPESARAAQTALRLGSQLALPEMERQTILLTIVEASGEAGALDMDAVNQWLTVHAKHPSPLGPAKTRILEKTAQQLYAAHQYPAAEKILLLLLGGSDGSPAPAENVNQVLAEYAEVCEAQDKTAEAAHAYERLARRMQTLGRLSDSEKVLLQAKALREKAGNPAGLVSALQSLGDVYLLEGKNAEARSLFEQTGNLLRQGNFTGDPRYAAVLNGLGAVAQAEREYEQAESLFDQAYDLLSKLSNPPRTILVSVLFNLGSLKLSNGKMTEANEYFDRCLQLSKGNFTPENPPPVEEFDRIAAAYLMEKRYDQAEELHQTTLKVSRDFFGDTSTQAGWSWYSLAVFYTSRQAYDKAAAAGEQALHIFETVAGRDSDEVSVIQDELAAIYHGKKDDENAISATERSAEIKTKLGRPRDEITLDLSSLGELYRGHQQYKKALPVYRQMAELWKAEGFGNPNYRTAVRNIVVCDVYLGDFQKAKELYQQLYAVLQKDADPSQKVAAARAYAAALRANAREKDARRIEDQASPRNPAQHR